MRSLMSFTVLGLTIACAAAGVSAGRPTPDQATIRLFEQADGPILPATRRLYSTHFDATRTRAIGLELTVGDPGSGMDREIQVACTMQHSDEATGAAEQTLGIEFAAQHTSPTAVGLIRHAPDLESWQPDAYEIECRADGRKIAESRIEISSNPADVAGTDIRVAALRLFPVERTLPAKNDRAYASTMVATETSHIGVEIEFSHAPPGRAMKIPVECYYFWPDGQTSPPIILNYEPQASWAGGYSAGAIGWDQPGNWLEGTYTVTCMIRGRPVIVERFDLR